MAAENPSRIIPLIMAMDDPEQERQRLAKLYAQMTEAELLEFGSEPRLLTEVARQVLQSEIERRGLDTARFESGTTPDRIEYRELTMIRRYRDLPEALLAKTSLESAGIECFLADENIVRMDWMWSNLLGGVKLYVEPEDADSAVKILDEPAPEKFDVSGLGQYERPRCPQCSSIDIHLEELMPVAFVTAYLWIPIPLHREGWKCHSCGHQWPKDENGDA